MGPSFVRERSGSAAMTAGAANVVSRRTERAAETQRRLEEGRAAAERAAAEQAAHAASLSMKKIVGPVPLSCVRWWADMQAARISRT